MGLNVYLRGKKNKHLIDMIVILSCSLKNRTYIITWRHKKEFYKYTYPYS